MVYEDDYHKKMRAFMIDYYHNRGGKIRKRLYDLCSRYNILKSRYKHLPTLEEQLDLVQAIAKVEKSSRFLKRTQDRAAQRASQFVSSNSNKEPNLETSSSVLNAISTGSAEPNDS